MLAVKGVLLTFLAALGSWGLAQAPPEMEKAHFPNINRELVGLLKAAQQLVAEKKWYEAVDRYQDLLRDHGDELAPANLARDVLASTERFVQVRWLIHGHLARLPAGALQKYRDRVDTSAAKWLEQGARNRDVRSLVQIVEQAFCSSATEPALELLGDMAFERGHFATAQHWWRLLTVPASQQLAGERAACLLVPDPRPATVARVRAKQIVTLLFQHQAERVAGELKAFRQLHAKATGKLVGKSGNYADTIEALARQGLGNQRPAEQEWPTFAGGPERLGTVHLPISQRLWAGGPAWRVDLVSGELMPDSVAAKDLAPRQSTLPPRCFPIVVGDRAFVASSRWVRGFDLRTGRLVFQFDLGDVHKVADTLDANLKTPGTSAVRFSLTASGDYLFARMGAPFLSAKKEGQKLESASWLVCLRVAEAAPAVWPKTDAQRHVWSVQAPSNDDEAWFFEGAPLVHDGSVYIAQSRLVGQKTRTVLCCFDAATGVLRWQEEMCETREVDERTPARCRHHLLTLAAEHVIYCAHAGAVVAVNARAGKIAWAVRYPGRGPRTAEGQFPPHDLCPAVAYAHCVLAAPADAPRLYCFDAFSGCNLWERDAVEVVHLLGVAHERLVFTTPKGIRAVQVLAGEDDGGWCQPGAGALAGYGRGLLADGWVLWPTLDAKIPFRAFDVVSGAQVKGLEAYDPGQMYHMVPGNLAYGRGCLVITTAEELLGYVPPQVPTGPPQT
jgi:outer membrane protein assembly factor BamB